MNRYDKALMAAVAIGIIGILITILPPLEDISDLDSSSVQYSPADTY